MGQTVPLCILSLDGIKGFVLLNPEWGQFGNKLWYYLCFSILFTLTNTVLMCLKI